MKWLISYYAKVSSFQSSFTWKFRGLLIENFLDYREYVREVKVRLVKYLTSCPLSPNHAKEFFTMLLDEYQALSKAFDILRPFFSKLVRRCFVSILSSLIHDGGFSSDPINGLVWLQMSVHFFNCHVKMHFVTFW